MGVAGLTASAAVLLPSAIGLLGPLGVAAASFAVVVKLTGLGLGGVGICEGVFGTPRSGPEGPSNLGPELPPIDFLLPFDIEVIIT